MPLECGWGGAAAALAEFGKVDAKRNQRSLSNSRCHASRSSASAGGRQGVKQRLIVRPRAGHIARVARRSSKEGVIVDFPTE